MARVTQSPQQKFIDDFCGDKADPLFDDICSLLTPNQLAMQISKSEGVLISLLIKLMGAKIAIELGTLAGYSATHIARALGSRGKLYCFDQDTKSIETYQNHLDNHKPLDCEIEFVIGDALANLENFNNPVDVFFIDADKKSYPQYLKHARRLLNPGGVLIADNVFLYGDVYDQPKKAVSAATLVAMCEFLQAVKSSKDFESVIISTTEGLLISRKCF